MSCSQRHRKLHILRIAFNTSYLVFHVCWSKTTPMALLYPHPPCSVTPVFFRPSFSPTLTFNHEDFVLNLDMEICETRPKPFVALVKLTPNSTAVFYVLPSAGADLNVCSFGDAGRKLVSSVHLELAALTRVKTMTSEDSRTVAQPISQYNMTVVPSTILALRDYIPMRTGFSLACVSMTISFLSFSIGFTLFRRQWQRFVKHPQRFCRGTHGQFLRIVLKLNYDEKKRNNSFPASEGC